MHVHMPTYVYTYIHTYIRTYIQACIYTCVYVALKVNNMKKREECQTLRGILSDAIPN